MKQQFSIAELERYTKIKAHTFRTWELRYEGLKSKRNDNKLRYYTIEDLDYLLDFCLLNRFGHKVSKLALLHPEQLREKVFELKDESARKENMIHKLIVYMFTLETENFESLLDHSISRYGFDVAMEDVILSFIERIDLFSYKGNSTAEYHFAITVLRKKIIVGIEQAKAKKRIAKTALLFLPEGEHFDLLLLYLHYKLQLEGIKSFYLGTNILPRDLKVAIQKKQPDFLVTFLYNEPRKVWEKLSIYVPPTSQQVLLVTKPLIDDRFEHSANENIIVRGYRSIISDVEKIEMPLVEG